MGRMGSLWAALSGIGRAQSLLAAVPEPKETGKVVPRFRKKMSLEAIQARAKYDAAYKRATDAIRAGEVRLFAGLRHGGLQDSRGMTVEQATNGRWVRILPEEEALVVSMCNGDRRKWAHTMKRRRDRFKKLQSWMARVGTKSEQVAQGMAKMARAFGRLADYEARQ